MKLQNAQTKENLVRRLKRIEGQVRGVQSMVLDERECREILQQLSAVRAAVQGATQAVLHEYATDCLVNLDEKDPSQRVQLVDDLVSMLGKSI